MWTSPRGLILAAVLTAVAAFVPTRASADTKLDYSLFDLGALKQTGNDYDSRPWSVNNNNWAVGNTYVPNATTLRAFLHNGIEMINLGLLGGGSQSGSHARDINDYGWICGAVSGGTGYLGFVYDGTNVRSVGHLGNSYSVANAINNSGVAVGWSNKSASVRRGFVWNGAIQELPTLGGTNGEAWDINNHGVIVGYSQDTQGKYRATIWTGGSATNLGSLGHLNGTESLATCINDKGWVAGFSKDASGNHHGFVYNGSTVTDLGTIDGGRCFIWGINNAGWVVGTVEKGSTGNYDYKPFLWHPTEGFVDIQSKLNLSASGWTLQELTDINEKNIISGRGRSPDGSPGRAFLLKPANVAQVFANQVYFQSHDQSVWWPGQGRFDFSYFIGPQWNFSKSFGGFWNVCFGPWHLWFITIPQFCLGEFGAKLAIASTGRAGLQVEAHADAGSVSLEYPMVVKLQFPDSGAVGAGGTFWVNSSYSTDRAANLSTSSASAYASLDAILRADSSAWFEAKAFGKSLIKTELLPGAVRSVDKKHNLFKTDEALANGSIHKDFSVFDGLLKGSIKLPRIGMAGSADSKGSDPHVINANAQDTFFSLKGSVSDAIARIFGLRLSVDFPIKFAGGGANIGLDLLAVNAAAQVSLAQNLSFSPTPRVRLEFSNGDPPVEFNAGESVQLTMPADPLLTIRPTIWLPNTFHNSTSLVVNGNMTFVPLTAHVEASAFGHKLAGFKFTPYSDDLGGGTKTYPVYNRSFELPGFQPAALPPFTVLGKRAIAPILEASEPSSAQVYIDAMLPVSAPERTRFQTFVSGATTVTLHGSNFDPSTTQVYFSIHGAPEVPMQAEVLSQVNIEVTIPNWYLLIAGTGRFVVTNNYGRSNSLDFSVTYPAPMAGPVSGSTLWANDPHFKDVLISVEPLDNQEPTYIRRLDYFQQLAAMWAETPNLPAPNAADYFTEFDFGADAILPVVRWNGVPSDDPQTAGSPLARYVAPAPSGALEALLPNAYFDRPIETIPIYLINPGPGGGPGNVVYGTIGALTPVISSLTPETAEPGSPTMRLVIKGPAELEIPGHPNDNKAANFVATSTVHWNGQPRPTVFVSTSELHVDIPPEDLAVGAVNQITVVTPGIANPTSNGLPFTVANPQPSLDALHPARAITADPAFDGEDFNLSISGRGFVPNSGLFVNGTKLDASLISFESSNVMQVKLPKSYVAQPGMVELRVGNPAPGGGSSQGRSLIVQNASPGATTDDKALWIKKISPTRKSAGAASFQLLVGGSSGTEDTPGLRLGNGFSQQSVILLNGKPLPTTFTQSSSIIAAIAPSDIAVPGLYAVTVRNPGPGGGISNPITLTIDQAGSSIKTFTISPTNVSGGKTAIGKVVLAAAAPAGGASIALAVNDTSVATAPATV